MTGQSGNTDLFRVYALTKALEKQAKIHGGRFSNSRKQA